MKHLLFVLSVTLCLTMQTALANKIKVSNVQIISQDTATNISVIQCDVSWDNSWRDAINWDAAWVFVKYKGSSGTWSHASLASGGFSSPSGSQISSPSDNKGFFIYRSAVGTGSNNWTVSLPWDYGASGLSDNDIVYANVYAVEMVYVPQGSFSVGDPNGPSGPTNCFYRGFLGSGAYEINSEGSIIVGNSILNSLYYANLNGYSGDQSGPIPAAFPKGYDAFYCMKYEISQGQYTDFLNSLTSTQAANRYYATFSNRHTIFGTYPNYIVSRPDRACGYIGWADGVANADWAALRPMTELEFEKACRGNLPPLANEYAWGTTTILYATNISGTEDGTETITDVSANCAYSAVNYIGGDAGQGPLRCGIFATTTSSRTAAGATYYGVMEMSGNLKEQIVSVGHADGRAFTGNHGNGSLDVNGDANVVNWPGTGNTGHGFRGGGWETSSTYCQIASRHNASDFDSPTSRQNSGFRSVRTAP